MITFHGQMRRDHCGRAARTQVRRAPHAQHAYVALEGGGWRCRGGGEAMPVWARVGVGGSVGPMVWAGRTVHEAVRGGIAAGWKGRRVMHADTSR